MIVIFIIVFVCLLLYMMAFKLFLHLIEWLGDTNIRYTDKNHLQETIEEFIKESDIEKEDEK